MAKKKTESESAPAQREPSDGPAAFGEDPRKYVDDVKEGGQEKRYLNLAGDESGKVVKQRGIASSKGKGEANQKRILQDLAEHLFKQLEPTEPFSIPAVCRYFAVKLPLVALNLHRMSDEEVVAVLEAQANRVEAERLAAVAPVPSEATPVEPPPDPLHDSCITVEEAATLLGKTKKWIESRDKAERPEPKQPSAGNRPARYDYIELRDWLLRTYFRSPRYRTMMPNDYAEAMERLRTLQALKDKEEIAEMHEAVDVKLTKRRGGNRGAN